MEPNQKERLLQETARLLIYVRMNTNSGVKVSSRLRAAACDVYCRKDYVAELCTAIRSLTEEEQARIVYDGRNSEARRLADWWDKHEEADRNRLEEEHRQNMRDELRNKALAKLTPEEIEALLSK
jgi:hypothetical protein